MNYLFPYNLVPKGSKIIIYGASNVGKDFYLQIFKLKDMFELKAWVDKSFDVYDELQKPFDYVGNIIKYDFDHIILAVNSKNIADEIKEELKILNISDKKIIWSSSYKFFGHEIVPKNQEMFIKNLNFFNSVFTEYINDKSGFGGSQFYQSFEKLSIEGQRDTKERIDVYNIKNLLSIEDTVLDIGCNCGFFDMQIAPYVKKVVGYEISPNLVNIAIKTSKFLNISNVEFHCEDFTKAEHHETYDVVLAFAIHVWFINDNFSEDDFVDLFFNLLKDGGYLFFESNDTKKFDESFKKLCSMFKDKGMKQCLHKNFSDTNRADINRDIIIFQKALV